MTGNDDDVGFGDFKFFSTSHSINGPGFSVNNTAYDEDDYDWGDFINSASNIPRTGSLPVNDIQFDPFPKSPFPSPPGSAPSGVESVKTQRDKMNGALPLSIFGEEEKEDDGSVAVDAGLNGMNSSFSFHKTGGNLKGNGLDLNDLIGDLYKQNEKGNVSNGFRSGVDVNPVVDLNPKVEIWNRNVLNSGINGLGLKMDTLDLGGNGAASVKKEENLGSNGYAFGMERQEANLGFSGLNSGSNGSGLGEKGLNLDSNVGNSDLVDEEDDDGWEFKAAEPKAEMAVENLKNNPNVPVSNFNMFPLSWDPLGANSSVLSSNINGVNANASSTNSNVVDENDGFSDDDGWEFKAAEPETRFGTGDTKEQENPKGPELSFGFGNSVDGSSDFFGTSVGISNKPGERNLGFSFSPSFESQNKQNVTENVEISSSVGKTIGSDEISWAFKEEPKVADASSFGVEDFSFGNHIQENEDTSKKSKGALPLSIFGDEEVETEDPLRYVDVSIKHNILRTDTHPNISINDLITSLYSQAEKKAPLNQISEPSENGLLSSHTAVGPDLANGDNNFDDDLWEFKDAVSGTRGENRNSPFDFGESYGKYSTKTELNDYVDLYSKLISELCFVALGHLDNMKKDKSIAAPSGEDSEVKAIEKEIQDLCNELQKDGIISEVALENLQSRCIHLGEYAKVLVEKKFQVLESEYQLSEKLSLAEKYIASTVELLRHAASTLKILKLGSVEDQSNYVATWLRILSVCELELKQGAKIWKQSLQNNIHNEILSEPQGRQYILALGEIFRVVRIIGSLSVELYKPWILFSSESHTNFLALVRECFTMWSSSGLEEALQSLTDSTDLKYDVEALLGSIRSIHDPDAHELYKQVFSGQEPTCCLSGLTAAAVPGMKMVLWDGRHYFVTIVNLWANLISRDPPNLPHIHARKC
ncbi:putative Glycoprotein membrane precursor GPI-anchored [Hibiscus syriacus]|uniref:Glycoprotein membrane GPI-anchored n=1 Tax=Hibiscus syriacus TaxID=106335 RepID=A0A6A2YHK2_HIBSY|nr:putative Glycoprotein membrane precursor GPI-anchored [Hibiscus syriacus]